MNSRLELRCVLCGRSYPPDAATHTCASCGLDGTLDVLYDLDDLLIDLPVTNPHRAEYESCLPFIVSCLKQRRYTWCASLNSNTNVPIGCNPASVFEKIATTHVRRVSALFTPYD